MQEVWLSLYEGRPCETFFLRGFFISSTSKPFFRTSPPAASYYSWGGATKRTSSTCAAGGFVPGAWVDSTVVGSSGTAARASSIQKPG